MYGNIITPLKDVESYNKDKVSLGKLLFFDTNLSLNGTISCASCHSDFGSDRNYVSFGVEDKKGQIQSLTVFNAIKNYKQFWNGRANNLHDQIDGPIHNKFEMGHNIESIEKYLNNSTKYKTLFKKAYNKIPSYILLKDAIVSFEETLITPNAPFDRYLNKEYTLTESEQKGWILFQDYGCAACHNGENIGGNSMQKIGNVIPYPYTENQADLYNITKKIDDKNVFKVPSLRNISKTAPYFHDSSAYSLDAAVIMMGYYNLGIVLNDDDVKDIISFLKTLDGEIPKTWSSDVQ